jgi:hypothetical protein
MVNREYAMNVFHMFCTYVVGLVVVTNMVMVDKEYLVIVFHRLCTYVIDFVALIWLCLFSRGSPNIEMDEETFLVNRERAVDYLNSLEKV